MLKWSCGHGLNVVSRIGPKTLGQSGLRKVTETPSISIHLHPSRDVKINSKKLWLMVLLLINLMIYI